MFIILKGQFFLLAMIFMIISCRDDSFREDIIFAGGDFVSASELNRGKMIYTKSCLACHGIKGDGKGYAGKGLLVPPRDFRSGIYKFGQVIAGELPHNEDFYEILDKGLKGTAMLPWDLSAQEKKDVINYIKTFALKVWKGKDKKLGVRILAENNPYNLAFKNSAIKRGEVIYHTDARCQSCHSAYLSPLAFKNLTGEEDVDLVEFFSSKPQDSEYSFKTIPPDFTWHEIRSATTLQELYVRIAAGVGGTSMPSWKDILSNDDLWALAYYVRSLMDLKGTPQRKNFITKLKGR